MLKRAVVPLAFALALTGAARQAAAGQDGGAEWRAFMEQTLLDAAPETVRYCRNLTMLGLTCSTVSAQAKDGAELTYRYVLVTDTIRRYRPGGAAGRAADYHARVAENRLALFNFQPPDKTVKRLHGYLRFTIGTERIYNVEPDGSLHLWSVRTLELFLRLFEAGPVGALQARARAAGLDRIADDIDHLLFQD